MKTKNALKLGILCLSLSFISSCKKDDDDKKKPVIPEKDNAVYVINEGQFLLGNGSIDYYNVKSDSILNDYYSYVNTFPLGDIVQSMTIFNDKGYICVNNSQKLEVVNVYDFNNFGTANGLVNPRYFCGVTNTKGYVSDWYSNHIKVIDLTTLAITDSIPTGIGPEQMVLSGNSVYLTNVGGYDNALSKQIYDSTVTVVDVNTNTVSATIVVGINGNSIRKDVNGMIWVLCGGSAGDDFLAGTPDDRIASLVRINPATNAVEQTFTFASGELPVKMTIDGQGSALYFLKGNDGYSGDVYKMNITDAALPTVALITKGFYGLGIGPKSGEIYCGYSPNFGQAGVMYRYKSDGSLISSKTTGVGPNGFAFY